MAKMAGRILTFQLFLVLKLAKAYVTIKITIAMAGLMKAALKPSFMWTVMVTVMEAIKGENFVAVLAKIKQLKAAIVMIM